ncbi:MAG TPA: Ada metal-binding domain-containing protein, partial [Azospira sp.]|nr:Ada metal-binding domain-containing protein [Azospira sp.]
MDQPLSPPTPPARPSAADISRDPRWAALCAREPAAEGQFVYAVRSTGIYCRPTCPSRRPKPENVAFYPDPAAAQAAGFRPCLRCRPQEPPLAARQAAAVAELCRFIEAAETPPSLAQLAHRAGLSPHHLHRLFKAHTGLTPKAYADARRAEKLRAGLAAGAPVTEALYAAGYNASSRFYEQAERVLGMAPGPFKAGGRGQEIRFAVAQTSLGALLAARSERGLCAILLGDEPLALVADLQARFPRASLIGSGPGSGDFEAWVAQVVGMVEC